MLREPCDVEVPLGVAAGLPADAVGRYALTTKDMVQRSQGPTPVPWSAASEDGLAQLLTWLNELFPWCDTSFPDVAEVDGAAAMWAAVPDNELHWLWLRNTVESMARCGFSAWED